jgi:hypothetical protein
VDGRWDEYHHHHALLRRYVDPERITLASGDSRSFQGPLDEAMTAWSGDTEDTGWDAFARDAAAALHDLAQALLSGRDAVVVTSGGVLGALAAGLLGAPAASAIALNRVAVNGAITTVTVGTSGASLLSFNDRGLISSTGAPSSKPSPGSVSKVTLNSSPFGARSPGATRSFPNSATTNCCTPLRSGTGSGAPPGPSFIFGQGGSTTRSR